MRVQPILCRLHKRCFTGCGKPRRCLRRRFSAAQIHPTALVHPNAAIAASASVGPFSIIGQDVTLGENCVVKSHVCIAGKTGIGEGCTIFPFSTLGEIPQDKKYGGQQTRLTIGERTTVRENCTINIGTAEGGGVTRIGSDCLLMASTHVGHDSIVGNDVVIANGTSLAGHVKIGDYAIVGGLCGIRQHVHIGERAMIGGASAVDTNVLPYGLVSGNRAKLRGVNLVGLRRAHVPLEAIKNLLRTFRFLFPDTLGSSTSALARPWDFDSPSELFERCQRIRCAIAGGEIEGCAMIFAVLDAIEIDH